jgi:tRNA G18 (ribose-2'-O)-methylase SpoU
MSTHRYLHLHHHVDVAAFASWADERQLPIVAIDNVPGSVPIEKTDLPRDCILLFGQEGPGLSDAAIEAALTTCAITQFGSTRSLNAGVASGIAMFAWAKQHA